MTRPDDWLDLLTLAPPSDSATVPSEFFTLSRRELLSERPIVSVVGPSAPTGDARDERTGP